MFPAHLMSYSSHNIHTYTTQKQTATIIKKYCLNWLNDEIGEEREGAAKKVAPGFLDINSTYTKLKDD